MDIKSTALMSALLLATSGPAFAQTGTPAGPPNGDTTSATPAPERGMGMHGGQGAHPHMQGGKQGHHHGMHHGMHGGGDMQARGGMMHGIRFPPGYEKLEMEMHAEMMESMARIVRKYAARLPDKP